VSCSSSKWSRFSGVFIATDHSANASLSLSTVQQSDAGVRVDLVILEPGSWGKFRGLPVRRDLAELIQLEQLTVMRLGGGMIDSNGWNWHHQVGPRENRPPNMCGVWDSVMSNGWGVFDFLNLAEALGVRPIVSVHLGDVTGSANANATGSLCNPSLSNAGSDHDSGGFANVSDPAGYIDYLFGPESTRWGAVRAQDGHKEPYVNETTTSTPPAFS
jgi:alpha-L-arabinofuranosidase